MPRRILSLPSLLLCAATLVLWIRSLSRFEAFVFRPDPAAARQFNLISDNGTLCLASRVGPGPTRPARWEYHTAAPGALTPFAGATGFLYRRSDRLHIIGMPHPFVCLLTLLPIAIPLWRARRKRPPSPHACPNCHYDLTGNQSGVCPECGAAR